MIEVDNILDVETYLDDIDVAIFDLDDTLYPEKEYVESGYRAIAKNYPYIHEMAERLWIAFENKKKAIDVVLDEEGLLSEKENCLKIYRFHLPEIHLYDGVRDMLQRLKSSKKLGIITDGRPEGQRAKLKALQLEHLVDEIIITDELGGIEFRKPNEAAFRLMQAKLQIPFDRMAYIGDNIKKDFIAPDKLGMKSIYFRNQKGIYIE